MAKDYSRIKAMAEEILKCIGDDEEGMDPSLPKQEQDIDDGGQDSPLKFLPDDEGEAGGNMEDKKRKKDSSLAMMGSVLAKKFGK